MTTSVQVQYRRGTASQIAAFTGAQGELVVDTTNNRLVVHDGATAGGWPAARLADVSTASRTAVSDAAYTALTTDRTIAFTALTAARTVSLPAAATFPVGTRLTIMDEAGAASGIKTITIAASGTDTIDGATAAVITSAYGYIALECNGSTRWIVVDQAASSLAAVGIGTAADPANPLSVTANNAFLDALTVGAGGTGDFRIKLNKATAANTASTLYQDAATGHAEVGLTGDDNFHFKVSPDGSTWYDALDITNSSGYVTANYGLSTVAPGAGDCSSRAITSAWHGQNLPGGMVNLFRNPGMDVAQRGTGTITASTAGAYTLDGWIVLPTGASVTAQQAPGLSRSANSLKIIGAASVTDVIVKQRIESSIAALFAGQAVTVQAKVYNNTGGSITPALVAKHAGSADNWTSPAAETANGSSLQACASGATTTIAYTLSISSSAANGLEIGFDFGNNFSANSKSIQVTELDIRVTPGVAIGLNGNPPPPELRPVMTELLQCQRYFYRRGQQNPGAGSDIIANLIAIGSTTAFGAVLQFPIPMRAAPAITVSSIGHLSIGLGSFGAGGITSGSIDGSSMYGAQTWGGLVASGASLTVGATVFLIFNNTSGWIAASAEL
jgi:hypothetical protein